MSKSAPVIITCAITGSIHTPSMSPYLPITPNQIADSAIEAAEAGAAIVHLHARNAENGKPTQDPDVFRQFLPKISSDSDVVVNITTGGSPTMSLEDRLQPALQLKPEIASLNMGSMGFGLYPALDKYETFQYPWEREYLEGTRDMVFKNTFKDIEYILSSCQENNTRFEIECYDIGHLYTAAHFFKRGLIKPPIFIQSVFGVLGGIAISAENIMHMKRVADELFGKNYVWSVLGAGGQQMKVNTMSAVLGGNCRVGLEDSLWDKPGTLAKTNAEQVKRIRSILETLSMEPASPDQAREILQLKGLNSVGF